MMQGLGVVAILSQMGGKNGGPDCSCIVRIVLYWCI